MQLQMKLSSEALSALEIVKNELFQPESNVSRGFLVEQVCFIQQSEVKNANWKEISELVIEGINYDGESLQTALVISDECEKFLRECQKIIAEQFGFKRVYIPFVIKLLLFKTIVDIRAGKDKLHEVHSDVMGIASLNFHDYSGDKPAENAQLKTKLERLHKADNLMSYNDILAFQEYIPEGNKWIDWWNGENTDYAYIVITPKAWDVKKNPYFALPIMCINEEIFKDYQQLQLDNDEDFSCRYVYAIVETQSGRKLRILNVHMIPVSDDEERNKTSKKMWEAVLAEVEKQKGCEEEFIVLGDFNAFDDEESFNRDNLLKLQRRMIDVTYDVDGEETKTYFHEGHKERQLDYIFVDRSTVFSKIIIPDVDKRSVYGMVSDHAIISCEISASITYEKF